MNPWERQPGETEEAYAAFCAYRDMGDGRTIDAAASASGHQGRSRPRHWMDWSSRWQWVDRAREWDNHRAGIVAEAEQKEIAKRATARERRRQEQIDIDLDSAKDLRSAALAALEALRPHLNSKVKRVTNDKGEKIEIHPAKISLRDIAASLKISTELERAALDLLPTQRHDHRIEYSAQDVARATEHATAAELDRIMGGDLDVMTLVLERAKGK